jgi:hypothetical protein
MLPVAAAHFCYQLAAPQVWPAGTAGGKFSTVATVSTAAAALAAGRPGVAAMPPRRRCCCYCRQPAGASVPMRHVMVHHLGKLQPLPPLQPPGSNAKVCEQALQRLCQLCIQVWHGQQHQGEVLICSNWGGYGATQSKLRGTSSVVSPQGQPYYN